MILKSAAIALSGLVVAYGARAADVASCLERDVANAIRKSRTDEAATRQIEQLCKKVGIEPKPGGAESLRQVGKLLLQDKSRGGDRLKPAAPPGVPTGPVMPVDGALEFDVSGLGSEVMQSLEVSGPDLKLRLQPSAGAPARIEASRLRPGAEYRWVLVTSRQTYNGSFSLPDTETMKRVQARVDKLKGLSDNAVTLLVLEAAIYDDEEIFASRDRTIAQLRRELQKP